MKEKMRKLLDQTHDVHTPLPIEEQNWAERRLAAKPVLESKLVDDMESTENWRGVTYAVSASVATNYDVDEQDPATQLAQLELSEERCVDGKHSLKFSCPTNLPKLNDIAPGRIYAVPCALRMVERENWEGYNRLSAWVYPVGPGIKTLTLRMQLHNDGNHKIPDIHNREGAHNMTLKSGQWNHVVLEMPYLARDCVTGVGFEYDMVGHENDAVDHVEFYLDRLEVQRVDCDVYSGWIPKNDRIVFSGSGYQPGSAKLAIASGIPAGYFRLIETESGRVVLEKPVETVQSRWGSLQIMDFTEIMEEGDYLLAAGELTTRVFSISNGVWENSIWKVLNFFLAERCGYEVLGKHRACHGDMLLVHGDQSIVANGGWHDAADVAQSLPNTSEGAAALLSLAISLEGRGFERLRERVIDEAKWGLDYVLKMRFGDGYRGTYSSASIWTDGVIGSHDDITTNASDNAYVNFGAAYAEALGARVFAEIDPDFARFCLKTAREDYSFGREVWERVNACDTRPYNRGGQPFANSDIIDAQVSSMGALTAAQLYALTGCEAYAGEAEAFADVLIGCQQQEFTDWKTPMVGFYYQDRERDLIWHHNHLSYSELPELAMRTLCEVFPDSPRYMDWYAALAMGGEYYRMLSKYTWPYGMIPAGVYHEDEAELGMKVQAGLSGDGSENESYRRMVRAGVPLGSGYYVRAFPVWFSYRGNNNVLLSEAVAMNASAALRSSFPLYDAAQNQYKFVVGQNPFGQSIMVGEGYDYVQHYAVQPGQTAGSLTVGMQSPDERDEPFWPQVDTATYKEVWICSATKWIWAMADSFPAARVYGRSEISVIFRHFASGAEYTAQPDQRSGFYEISLPAGRYRMSYGDFARELTVVTGRDYHIDADGTALTAQTEVSGGTFRLTLTASAREDISVELRFFNISGLDGIYRIPISDGAGEFRIEGTIENRKKPYVGVVTPNGNTDDRIEILDERLLSK